MEEILICKIRQLFLRNSHIITHWIDEIDSRVIAKCFQKRKKKNSSQKEKMQIRRKQTEWIYLFEQNPIKYRTERDE